MSQDYKIHKKETIKPKAENPIYNLTQREEMFVTA